jgi:PAS domain S-box-containing protein
MNPRNPVILCVDDEEANLKLLEHMLVPRGYAVVGAASGKDALLQIKSQKIDLVLLDILMPGMDGFEVCRQIKEDQKLRDIPVILVTALSAKQDHIRGIEAGADEFLAKPIEKTMALARIKILLKVKELNDERKRYEEFLQKSHAELDYRVRERTAELAHANEMLQADITKRKQAELQLKEALEALGISEENFRRSLDDSPLGVRVVTAKGETIYGNKVLLDIYGYLNVEELNKIPLKERYTPQSYAEFQIRKKARERGDFGPSEYEINIVRKNGEIRHLQVLRKEVLWNGIKKFQVIYQDITERKRAEEVLQIERDRAQQYLDIAGVILVSLAPDLTITLINKKGCELLGYGQEELVGKNWFDLILPEREREKIKAMFARLLGGELELLEQVVNNVVMRSGEERMVSWHNTVVRDSAGNIVGTLSSGEDITRRMQTEEELKRTLESLRKAFGATIQVLVSAVEARDPYTSGHQIRSADLARAIATEMGLSQEKVDGIRMAGSIHDIGKLSVPAEILSKPTKLTSIEFSLIQEHSLRGYEMLKDVESPWPLAQIVYQHHERMNGSGYPRNLKGDEILMDARIMAVADVVEAMASHRPYRPALGLDAALEEIEKNKGILYDNAVADVCLRLFRKRGYKLLVQK